MNLLSSIIVYYNTVRMQQVVERLTAQGYPIKPEHLGSIWPTRFAHTNVYGSYQFDREGIAELQAKRGLRSGSQAMLPLPSPLRTARTSFPVSGSSLSKPPNGNRINHRKRWVMHLFMAVGMQHLQVGD